MPSITEVAQAANVGRADVIRLLREGGTSETDWRIARTVERLGGRRASELMLTAGRDQMIARIWGDSGETAQPPALTNPEAKHNSEVRIYAEPTAPDAPPTVLPDHPSEAPEDDSPAARHERHQVRVWAAVAGITNAPTHVIDRITSRWTSTRDIRRGLTALLRRAAATGSERRRARAQHLLDTYALAA